MNDWDNRPTPGFETLVCRIAQRSLRPLRLTLECISDADKIQFGAIRHKMNDWDNRPTLRHTRRLRNAGLSDRSAISASSAVNFGVHFRCRLDPVWCNKAQDERLGQSSYIAIGTIALHFTCLTATRPQVPFHSCRSIVAITRSSIGRREPRRLVSARGSDRVCGSRNR